MGSSLIYRNNNYHTKIMKKNQIKTGFHGWSGPSPWSQSSDKPADQGGKHLWYVHYAFKV